MDQDLKISGEINNKPKDLKKRKMFKFLTRRRVIYVILILAAVAGYYFYKSKTASTSQPIYTMSKVARGMIMTTVSGSGQVSSSNLLDIKPKISANIIAVKVKAGQKVKMGDVLVELDKKEVNDAVKQTRNSLNLAQANLNTKLAGLSKEEIIVAQKSVDSAKLNLDSAKQSAITDVAKAQSDYNNALSSGDLNNSSDNQALSNIYVSAKGSLNSSFITLRSSLITQENILLNSNTSITFLYGVLDPNSLAQANTSHSAAKNALTDFQNYYNSLNGNFTNENIEEAISKEIKALEAMKDFAHNMYSMLLNTITSAYLSQTTLDNYRSSMASQESSLLSSINSLQTAQNNIAKAKIDNSSSGLSSGNSVANALTVLNNTKISTQKNLTSAQLSYDTAVASYNLKVVKPRDVDIATLQIQISSARDSYNQALENLNEAIIKAPFDVFIVKVYQTVSEEATPATALVNIVTPFQIAEISLNEVDVAKVKVGQKVSLTYSAIDNLSISGVVAEIDNTGVVNQGVVTYGVKITFDTQDDRIKPQMTVSAIITTEQKTDVLIVPNSALKSDSSGSYVETLDIKDQVIISGGITSKTAPLKKYLEIGLTGDMNTEISSGLNEGDEIITKTISNTVSTAAVKSTSSGLGGMFGGGGGGQRRPGN